MFDWNSDLGVSVTKRLLELKFDSDAEHSERDITDILNTEFDTDFTRNQIHHQIYKLDEIPRLADKDEPFMPYYNKYREYVDGDLETKKDVFVAKPDMKILNLNDLHIPYQIEECFQEAVDRNRGADVVVISEFFDMLSLSSFGDKAHVPLEFEIEQGLRVFEYLSETFPYTLIIDGNHDNGRILRSISKRLPGHLMFLVEMNILRRLAAPFKNVQAIPYWAVKINDAVFTHGYSHSSIPMRSADRIYEHFVELDEVEYDLGDWNFLVQAHTHHQGVIYRSGKKIVESGCMCYPPEWYFNKPSRRSWDRGWVTVVQKEGKTVNNLSREYYYPYTPKASLIKEF